MSRNNQAIMEEAMKQGRGNTDAAQDKKSCSMCAGLFFHFSEGHTRVKKTETGRSETVDKETRRPKSGCTAGYKIV